MIAAILLNVLPCAAQDVVQMEDSLIVVRLFEEARGQDVRGKLVGEIMVWVGKQFIGAPYTPHTLELPGEEQLVINLREFDCVTFVESVLALAQCIKTQSWTFGDFKHRLRQIRYRDGILNGYASRLHYFSEWIANNQQKGIVANLTTALGGELKSKRINWMTQHRTAYRQLSDPGQFERIAEIERKRSRIAIPQIPKTALSTIVEELMDGDIVAFVSTRPGLDVGHVALVARSSDGSAHLLHASDRSNKVVLTAETLEQYFQYLPNASGVMIVRPIMKSPKE